jgi:hypothetical protein
MTTILWPLAIGLIIACVAVGRHVRGSLVWLGWWAGFLFMGAIWASVASH